MSHLLFTSLGSFHVALDGESTNRFESDKVRALLAYLVVESAASHRRTILADLLWPNHVEQRARRNLNQALYNLRRTINGNSRTHSYIIADTHTIQFDLTGPHDVDIVKFTELLSLCDRHQHQTLPICDECLSLLRQATDLYKGDFLAGFSVRDAPAFDEWVRLTQERFHLLMMTTLDRLVDNYESRDMHDEALTYARKQVELEPWREESHQKIMQLLADRGQLNDALAQYERCCHILLTEFNTKPSEATMKLYERIRQSSWGIHPYKMVSTVPSFLKQEPPLDRASTVFVARDLELEQLHKFLDTALNGKTQFAFIQGGTGYGKTALVHEFMRRAQEKYPDLLVLNDSCNAYSGIGDPYLPFRKALELLTGGVESRYVAGSISHEQATRLWQAMPFTARTLLEVGPNLIGKLIVGEALWTRVSTCVADDDPWLHRLRTRVQQPVAKTDEMQQPDLFEQYMTVLQDVSQTYPLILFVDDLQWADIGSISLLFHVGQRLSRGRLLIIGAYRTDEIMAGRDGKRHPLALVLHEFQRVFGDVTIDLERSDGLNFIEKFIDLQPNKLRSEFRQTLFQHTEGHPLFTIELFHGMRERGELVQDDKGEWREGTTLAWAVLPARVEAVVAERIDRLPRQLQDLLTVASVEGEEFTAESIARIQGIDVRAVINTLEIELGRTHGLVHARDIRRFHEQYITRYRFRHHLFQIYLYARLNDVQRTYLHEDMGNALESIHAADAEALAEISGSLARHFREAGNKRKAIHYLQQAGDRAMYLFASEEASDHLSNAIMLLKLLPDTPQRSQQELILQLRLASQMVIIHGHSASETKCVYDRARDLSLQIENDPEHLLILYMLWTYYLMRAELQPAGELAERIETFSQFADDSTSRLTTHWALGVTLLHSGELTTARCHLEQMINLYEPQLHGDLIFSYALEPKATGLFWLSRALWYLGYPDQALRHGHEAVMHARAVAHPYTLAVVLSNMSWIYQDCGLWQAAKQAAVEAIDLSAKHGIPQLVGLATIMHGASLAALGDTTAALAELERGIVLHRDTGSRLGDTYFLSMQAELYGSLGDSAKGLQVITDAIDFSQKNGEQLWSAELHQIKGKLLLMQVTDTLEDSREVEERASACFLQALEVSRRQESRSLELRATMNLAKLYQHQGKSGQAQRILSSIYEWFVEGFDTADLVEAKVLLEVLTQNENERL